MVSLHYGFFDVSIKQKSGQRICHIPNICKVCIQYELLHVF